MPLPASVFNQTCLWEKEHEGMICMCVCNTQQDRGTGVVIPPHQVVMSITKTSNKKRWWWCWKTESDSLPVRVQTHAVSRKTMDIVDYPVLPHLGISQREWWVVERVGGGSGMERKVGLREVIAKIYNILGRYEPSIVHNGHMPIDQWIRQNDMTLWCPWN